MLYVTSPLDAAHSGARRVRRREACALPTAKLHPDSRLNTYVSLDLSVPDVLALTVRLVVIFGCGPWSAARLSRWVGGVPRAPGLLLLFWGAVSRRSARSFVSNMSRSWSMAVGIPSLSGCWPRHAPRPSGT